MVDSNTIRLSSDLEILFENLKSVRSFVQHSTKTLIVAFQSLGFPASLISEDSKASSSAKIHRRETRRFDFAKISSKKIFIDFNFRWRNAFILAAFFGIPAMIIMMIFMFIWKDHHKAPQVYPGLSLENLIMFSLSTPVQVNHQCSSKIFITEHCHIFS